MQPRDLNITTRFARDMAFVEMNFLSIAAETPAMESPSTADADIWRAKGDDRSYNQAKSQDYIHEGLWHFAFRRLSEKENNK